jgi:hypothetical protein
MAADEPAAASSDLPLVVLPFRAAVPASRSITRGTGHTRARASPRSGCTPCQPRHPTPSLRASTRTAAWENSVLLTDPVKQVPGLKREKDLIIMGSSALIQSLSRAGLIDEYLLTITPLVLGQGRRLFPAGFPHTKLTLTSTSQ